jgi:pimeloyl-ACP methyl ester carboxylesterase
LFNWCDTSWLNNDQAFADSANFMKNVKFPNITRDLTAPSTPWIYYGGSYGGARAAYMRVLYPDLVYGAIASSGLFCGLVQLPRNAHGDHAGVVEATLSMWQYSDSIRLFANQTCMGALSSAVATIDGIVAKNNTVDVQTLKGLFGLADIVHTDDFASALQVRLSPSVSASRCAY